MENLINLFSRIRIVYRRTKPLTKIVVLAAVAFSMAALIMLHISLGEADSRNRELRQQASVLEQQNSQLEENIDNLGSVQSVQHIAQEELGMVDPNAVAFQPEQ